MDRIHKFFDLPQAERWFFLKTSVLLGVVRISLHLLPFSCVRRVLSWASRCSPRLSANPLSVERIVWTVDAASRFVPGARHCLTQALVAQIFLLRRGYPAVVRFGVLPESKESGFIAHAWVESNGSIVIGGNALNVRYTRLTSPTDRTE